MQNRQVLLKSRPTGIPQAEHFEITERPAPELREGQILVRNQFLSVEPAMRGWVNAAANYSTPVGIGEVMRSIAAGTVIASKNPKFAEGDRVMGMFGWQDFAAADASAVTRKVKENDLPLSLSLGMLGLNGVTAYFALLDVGRPRPGDTVAVSTAAGSVGSAVGQIAKIAGCRTVGIAGGPVKAKLCTGIRLRRSHRLQGAAARRSAGRRLPTRRERLFRQHQRADQRHRDDSARAECACGHLRHSLDRELGPAADGTARRAPPAGEAGADGWLHRVRLPAPLRGSGHAARRMDSRGAAVISGGYPGGHRRLSGCHREPLSRREPRQAAGTAAHVIQSEMTFLRIVISLEVIGGA